MLKVTGIYTLCDVRLQQRAAAPLAVIGSAEAGTYLWQQCRREPPLRVDYQITVNDLGFHYTGSTVFTNIV